MLLHVRLGIAERGDDRVRLRRAREVDRRLGEVELHLRETDVLDGVRRGDRDEERTRVSVADVLGGEDDHPAGDEARILAAREHRGEVVDGGVRIRGAHRLDERRDEVVVRVAALVVDERPLAGGVLDVLLGEGLALGSGRVKRELEDVERVSRVAAGAAGDQLDELVRDLEPRAPRLPAARSPRAPRP